MPFKWHTLNLKMTVTKFIKRFFSVAQVVRIDPATPLKEIDLHPKCISNLGKYEMHRLTVIKGVLGLWKCDRCGEVVKSL